MLGDTKPAHNAGAGAHSRYAGDFRLVANRMQSVTMDSQGETGQHTVRHVCLFMLPRSFHELSAY